MNVCPRGNKNCEIGLMFRTKKNNYVCSGFNKNPTKYHKDIVNLCSKGFFTEFNMEMTKEEALYIISVLSSTMAFIKDKNEK